MRNCLIVLFLFLGLNGGLGAEETVSHNSPVVSTYLVHTGEQFQAPHVLTYKMLEFSQQRGRWTLPDVGIYTGAGEKDKLLFGGAGADFRLSKKALLTQEIYFAQDTGPGSHHARSLWLWPVFNLDFAPRWLAQVVAYPTIPLNRAALAGFDVDRAKLQYDLRRNFAIGGGYNSSKCEGSPWKNRPFLTTTVSSIAGSFEFWLQKTPGGGQLQLRYTLNHSER